MLHLCNWICPQCLVIQRNACSFAQSLIFELASFQATAFVLKLGVLFLSNMSNFQKNWRCHFFFITWKRKIHTNQLRSEDRLNAYQAEYLSTKGDNSNICYSLKFLTFVWVLFLLEFYLYMQYVLIISRIWHLHEFYYFAFRCTFDMYWMHHVVLNVIRES